jgi:hypothetical protein
MSPNQLQPGEQLRGEFAMPLPIAFSSFVQKREPMLLYVHGNEDIHLCFYLFLISSKDGYSAYPSGAYPTQCVCSYPYTECNGKCGTFRGCPSTYYAKREIAGKCSEGYTACGVPGAGAKSWDCIDTQTDLESCTSHFILCFFES